MPSGEEAEIVFDSVRVGIGRFLVPVPRFLWRRRVSKQERELAASLRFMSMDHHRVREFVVEELPRAGEPLSPKRISVELDLPAPRTMSILHDLERNKNFLHQDEQGAVAWAYPVTVERTPHAVTFDSGEKLYAA